MLFAKEDTQCRWILRHIFTSLKHLGIGPFDERKVSHGRGLYQMFVRSNLVTWLLRAVLVFIFNQGKGDMINRMFELLKAFGCIVFHWKFAQHHDAIVGLFEKLDELRHHHATGSFISRISKYCVLSVWIFEASRIPTDYAAFIVERKFDKFVERDLLLKPGDISGAMAPVVHGLAILTFTMERILISGTISTVLLVFSFINILLISKFRRYDGLMRDLLAADTMDNPSDMFKLRLIHADLCLLTQKIDDIFSTMVFVMHSIGVLQLCLEVNRFFVMSTKGLTTFGLYNWALDALYGTMSLLLLLFSAASLCQSPKVSFMTINQFGLRSHSELYEHQLELTQSQMGVIGGLQLTAGRFYNMDRSTFITSLGLIASFVVFSMQMPELAT